MFFPLCQRCSLRYMQNVYAVLQATLLTYLSALDALLMKYLLLILAPQVIEYIDIKFKNIFTK